MSQAREDLEGDWLYGVFGVFREEMVSLSADFGEGVKREIDAVAGVQDVNPPSATSLLTAVAMETAKMAVSLLRPGSHKADESGEEDYDSHEHDGDDEEP